MNTYKHQNQRKWHGTLITLVTALCFITVGIMIMGKNVGWISSETYSVVVSWQLLLIVIGGTALVVGNMIGGLIMITTGVYFIIPKITFVSDEWMGQFLPILLIIVGVIILLKLVAPKSRKLKDGTDYKKYQQVDDKISYGFVKSDVSFGSSKHIVLDPVFYGADIDVAFGSVQLDLRRTSLEREVTIIDVDCAFSGVEILVPASWNIVYDIENSLGGINDKRFISKEIMDMDHKLLIRGDVSLSGIDIKN